MVVVVSGAPSTPIMPGGAPGTPSSKTKVWDAILFPLSPPIWGDKINSRDNTLSFVITNEFVGAGKAYDQAQGGGRPLPL